MQNMQIKVMGMNTVSPQDNCLRGEDSAVGKTNRFH